MIQPLQLHDNDSLRTSGGAGRGQGGQPSDSDFSPTWETTEFEQLTFDQAEIDPDSFQPAGQVTSQPTGGAGVGGGSPEPEAERITYFPGVTAAGIGGGLNSLPVLAIIAIIIWGAFK